MKDDNKACDEATIKEIVSKHGYIHKDDQITHKRKCGECEGRGHEQVDSGAYHPWGEPIGVPKDCPSCTDGEISEGLFVVEVINIHSARCEVCFHISLSDICICKESNYHMEKVNEGSYCAHFKDSDTRENLIPATPVTLPDDLSTLVWRKI